ncbi:MAG: acetyl-CoA carboxylase biotin carboxyl carrier protein [Aerococcaceae bacterium]|nr:acetyl-CoA carboxylase biotin carboxyl carrier protein [Aerococcaceae bacterium]
MQYQDLEKLIDKLDQSSVAYLEYKTADETVILAKEVPAAPQVVQPIEATATAPTSTPATPETVSETPAPQATGNVVNAPLVGVAYLQPNPEADAYVNIGDTVQKGDVLCLIEAMKLMNEIHAPQSGVITEILVSNEQVVEFNQPLFRIQS